MTGTAEDIADRIAALGYGSVTGTITLFTGELPPSPDDCIAVMEMHGGPPVRAMGPKVVMDRPDVQVFVRRKTYASLVSTVRGIIGDGAGSGLDGWKGTIDGRSYYWIGLAYEPIYLGRDENNRRVTSIVFNTGRQR